jgi:hypothetical protein
MNIPVSVLKNACNRVEETENRSLPFLERGIKVDRNLIEAVIEILNASPSKTLPQNCRNAIRDKTPDGLDRRIKEKLNTDLRTANIISDILARAGIVEIIRVINPATGRLVKGTRLIDERCWVTVANSEITTGKDALPGISDHDKTNKNEANIKKGDYLNCSDVRQFITWLEKRLDENDVFEHRYYFKKAGQQLSCASLYEAYESYWWPFNLTCPVTGTRVKGTGFTESFSFLTRLAEVFRVGIQEDDVETTRRCALAMLEWGGVLNKNREQIEALGKGICTYFREVQNRLNLSEVSLGEQHGMYIYMNSGFTKLYHLLIDNFIMYDGRVGAAMGLLVRSFCEEEGLREIPGNLFFAYGRGREAGPYNSRQNRRDPSRGPYKFPEFTGDRWRHLNDNIKASWLLKEVADHTISRFSRLPQEPPLNERLTALQSALFMIGYDVRTGTRKTRWASKGG